MKEVRNFKGIEGMMEGRNVKWKKWNKRRNECKMEGWNEGRNV